MTLLVSETEQTKGHPLTVSPLNLMSIRWGLAWSGVKDTRHLPPPTTCTWFGTSPSFIEISSWPSPAWLASTEKERYLWLNEYGKFVLNISINYLSVIERSIYKKAFLYKGFQGLKLTGSKEKGNILLLPAYNVGIYLLRLKEHNYEIFNT